jgi:hypothetical protein
MPSGKFYLDEIPSTHLPGFVQKPNQPDVDGNLLYRRAVMVKRKWFLHIHKIPSAIETIWNSF